MGAQLAPMQRGEFDGAGWFSRDQDTKCPEWFVLEARARAGTKLIQSRRNSLKERLPGV